MHYVKKQPSPIFFEECKKSLPASAKWPDFTENQALSECKKQLHEQLIQEQSELCIYCERKIHKNASHIEHINPKSTALALTFTYTNLVASCNGDLCDSNSKAEYKPEDINSCGHKKDNDFNEQQFLNPVEVSDIIDYFAYNKTTCTITASNKDSSKAQYTIGLLNLNNPRLNNERSNARAALERALKTTTDKKAGLRLLLAKDRPFISSYAIRLHRF